MLAVEIAQPGGPEMLRPARRSVPEPGEGEVLVRVAAAGVNRPDVMQRQGRYPPPPGASDIPGLEIAGCVVAVGPNVTSPAIGDRVCALLTGGGYAEYCLAPAPLCLPLPVGFDEIQGACLPETMFTVWANVFDRGRLAPDESLLVHGGTSGIGVSAIQIARALGSTVYATAGTPQKCQACEALGAVAINYRSEDFVEAVERLSGGRGIDVILDMVGGDYLSRNLACLASAGRLVQIAVQGGVKAEINLWTVMAKRLTVTGSTLRSRSVAEKAAIAKAVRERVWPLLESGAIRPMIHAEFPLEAAAEAHRVMESGQHIGKLVLRVGR
ncbi:MAG: NAD(P)H-quinone oxidoreductase [Methylococcaceae bacterium]|nr:NAD(P)H-quinone oxidoreductase [Methylococcaceae bacterium]